MSAEVCRDLAELRGKISEYEERKIAAEDQLKRIDLRAPQSAFVHQLDVHAVGGVISPGQAVMSIVPDAEVLKVEAKVQPEDIDQLRIGQLASLRFTAFNQRITLEVDGEVGLILPDVSVDKTSGTSYCIIRISVSEGQMELHGKVKLVQGMPVEVFMQTGLRSIASFVARSITDQLSLSFRQR